MSTLESIAAFLAARRSTHNGPDLLDLWTPALETQVNVAVDAGDPVADKRHTWTDGLDEWHHIRIPRHADSEPEFTDYGLRFDLAAHAEAIGSTGWDWRARESRFVGFDFDHITGHAAGVGIGADQLDKVKAAAVALPYVTARRSTGGSGLHLYCELTGVATANHTEHAALARAVLGMMSGDAGFDFQAAVDCCGGNMWIWHRRATRDNRGFELLKKAERQLAAGDLPANWHDNLEVVCRRRAKIQVRGIAAADEFDELASARKPVPLDDGHKRIIEALNQSGFSSIWVPDFHCVQTHTAALKWIFDAGGIAGFFDTVSPGSDPGSPNCFCFPVAGGGFRVYRFSRGCQEAATWNRDDWTWCDFNVKPDLPTAAKAFGANEDDSGAWVFKAASQMEAAVEALGESLTLPEKYRSRQARLNARKDGRYSAHVERQPGDGDDPDMSNWVGKPKHWVKVIGVAEVARREQGNHDPYLRALATPSGESAGVFTLSKAGTWDRHSMNDAKKILQSKGMSKDEADCALGDAKSDRWESVNLPFQPEYPGGRRWNKDAAQLRYQPADITGPHLHWDKVLDHAGQSLTPALKDLTWASGCGIRTGADYLRALFACIIRAPFEPTPYLFFHGPENSGKSIVWEAFDLLVTRGVVKADRSLTNQNDFNGELAGAILCVVEEKDISRTPGALNKIKDAVTSPTLSIRKMRTDSYSQPNTTHWLQFSNDEDACPVFAGDSRITSIYVPPLDPGAEIPKATLLERLRVEAPAFLRTILDITLPPLLGRLRLPMVETAEKKAAILDRSPVAQFIADCCTFKPEAKVAKAAVYQAYKAWAIDHNHKPLNDRHFGRAFIQAAGNKVTTGQKIDTDDGRKDAYGAVGLSA